MNLLLRILLLFTIALFWGGLTFYTGFVVRISHDVLDNPMDGGLITQKVTLFLQWAAAISVLPMAINGIVVRNKSRQLGTALLVCTTILACAVAGLFLVHRQLDSVIDVSAAEITDQDAFAAGHRRYNQLTTVEWLATVVYLFLTAVAWKSVDSATATKHSKMESADTKPEESPSSS